MPVTRSESALDASAWFFERVADDDSLVERSAGRGAMPPLHLRDEDETVNVVDGELVFYVGGDVVTARAGDVVVVPGGAARTFRVESDTARWLVLTRVRSPRRYRDFARAVAEPRGAPAAGWPSADELSSVAAIAAANGIELLGPPGALP